MNSWISGSPQFSDKTMSLSRNFPFLCLSAEDTSIGRGTQLFMGPKKMVEHARTICKMEDVPYVPLPCLIEGKSNNFSGPNHPPEMDGMMVLEVGGLG